MLMPDLPSHSDSGSTGTEPGIAPASRRRKAALVGLVVGLLVLFVVLHLTGVVGAESH
jgi:hypothetical protein